MTTGAVLAMSLAVGGQAMAENLTVSLAGSAGGASSVLNLTGGIVNFSGATSLTITGGSAGISYLTAGGSLTGVGGAAIGIDSSVTGPAVVVINSGSGGLVVTGGNGGATTGAATAVGIITGSGSDTITLTGTITVLAANDEIDSGTVDITPVIGYYADMQGYVYSKHQSGSFTKVGVLQSPSAAMLNLSQNAATSSTSSSVVSVKALQGSVSTRMAKLSAENQAKKNSYAFVNEPNGPLWPKSNHETLASLV